MGESKKWLAGSVVACPRCGEEYGTDGGVPFTPEALALHGAAAELLAAADGLASVWWPLWAQLQPTEVASRPEVVAVLGAVNRLRAAVKAAECLPRPGVGPGSADAAGSEHP